MLFLSRQTVEKHLVPDLRQARRPLARRAGTPPGKRAKSGDLHHFLSACPGSTVGTVPSYFVEGYVPRSRVDETRRAGSRARSAAEQLAREGTPVSYVRTTFLPEDETCFHVFEAPSAEAVGEVGRRAGLDWARIVPAVESDGPAGDLGHEAARDRLVAVLRDASGLRDDEPAVLADLLRRLEAPPGEAAETWTPAAWLARTLTSFADGHGPAPLADLIGLAARGLAPDGAVPTDAAGRAAWRAALTTVEQLYGGGFCRLGRLPFVSDDELAALLAEAGRSQRSTIAVAQQIADPGPALRRLAVDPRLRDAVSEALGVAVEPTYRAVYMFYEPHARVDLHVDHADYEVIVHLTLAHDPPDDGSRRAALVVYRLDRPPARVELAPGEAMTLRGRGSVHTREPLKGGEHWTTLAIGFKPRARRET